MSELIHTVAFDRIRYAACWEDADLLIKGLAVQPADRVLCIASGGDNALALLTQSPRTITAIDINPIQLYLTELKQKAFTVLSYNELLLLLGVQPSTATLRLRLFSKIKPLLSESARAYWLQHTEVIEKGLIYAGKFERYFSFFRRYLLPLVHSKKNTAQLLAPKSDEEQQLFFKHTWNSRRWRLLMALFFNRYTMGRYGRDPQFLKQVKLNVSDYIIDKAATHLQSSEATRNYFLHMIMTGSYGDSLPLYLRPQHFETIKANAHRLRLQTLSAETIIQREPFDVYGLSNFFEYLSAEQFERLAALCSTAIGAGARVAYWNLMVIRSLHAALPGHFSRLQVSEQLTSLDKGFFYNRFIIDQKL